VGGAGLVVLIAVGVPVVGWWEAVPGWLTGGSAVVAGLLAAVLGGWLPARRAAKVDPQRMLKSD
jgi:ABC-type antimicrobial peptide transport system permease subunit